MPRKDSTEEDEVTEHRASTQKPRTLWKQNFNSPTQFLSVRLSKFDGKIQQLIGAVHHLTCVTLQQVVNIEKPACYLRKFSPCGKHLIAFSSDQASLEIYEFRGCSAASDLIGEDWTDEVVPNISKDKCYDIRSKIFERFFKVN